MPSEASASAAAAVNDAAKQLGAMLFQDRGGGSGEGHPANPGSRAHYGLKPARSKVVPDSNSTLVERLAFAAAMVPEASVHQIDLRLSGAQLVGPLRPVAGLPHGKSVGARLDAT